MTTSKRVKKLISKMSAEDKIGQMSQVDLSVLMTGENGTTVSPVLIEYYFGERGVGSILNNMVGLPWEASDYRKVMKQIQDVAANYSRPPVLWGLDSVHGANYIHGATITPQPLGLAATFNRTVAHRAGQLASRDTRAAGIQWLFSPLIGIALEPKWSRVYETFGEDPFLVGQMALHMIEGIQEDDETSQLKAAACAKHFLGYSMPHNGHDRSPSWIPKRHLYQYFLPPWRDAVKKVLTVMESYTEYNGVPNVANGEALNRLLRTQLEFDGMVVTDYEEMYNLYQWHHVSDTKNEGVVHSVLEASVDMSMIPKDLKTFRQAMLDSVANGRISHDRLDASVERILGLKEELGLLDHPIISLFDDSLGKIGGDREEALDMTHQSIVLVKNKDDVLPIPQGDKNVVVTGPTADSLAYQSGGWTWQWQGVDDGQGWFTYGTTVLTAAQNVSTWEVIDTCGVGIEGLDCATPAPKKKDIFSEFESWVGLAGGEDGSIKQVTDKAGRADYVIVCVGEENYAEKPGDINSLQLSLGQLELVHSLTQTDTKVILVYFGGRPRLLADVVDSVDAVLIGFLPGPDAGQAIIDIITGKVNPSGRLPMTYPKFSDGSGAPYFHSVSDQCTEGEGPLPHWNYVPCEVQWPFGYGLSYTSFVYSNLKVSTHEIHYSPLGKPVKDVTEVSVVVKNIGEREGTETVMFFTFDESRSVTPEYKRLRDFEKVYLKPGEEETVTMKISTSDLNFHFVGPHDDTHYILEDGLRFRVGVGMANCRDGPKAQDMCSDLITIRTDNNYIAACDAACKLWQKSSCARDLDFSLEECWDSCTSDSGEEGWGWNYVNCIEGVIGKSELCGDLTSQCRNIFGSDQTTRATKAHVPDGLAVVLGVLIVCGGFAFVVLSIRGEISRLWDCRRRQRFAVIEAEEMDI